VLLQLNFEPEHLGVIVLVAELLVANVLGGSAIVVMLSNMWCVFTAVRSEPG
jgi:hypothetical protein